MDWRNTAQILLLFALPLLAETGHDAWLRYTPTDNRAVTNLYERLPATVVRLDNSPINWWDTKADEIYRLIPDFGGFVLKADSEGQLGPSIYGRNHADAESARTCVEAAWGHSDLSRLRLQPLHMDWRNMKNDRARAAYDNFHELDGKFDENAAVQIKYGPIRFSSA